MRITSFLALAAVIGLTAISKPGTSRTADKPKISFTFDDGSVSDYGDYKLEEWNSQLLNHLKKHALKSILFSMGHNKGNEKGRYVLSSWNIAGHLIANHTFSHPSFSSNKVSLEDFKIELLRNDSIIKAYSNYAKFFRFPYLKEGNTAEKVEGFRSFLKEQGYQNGHVSVDASDWYIDGRLAKRLRENPGADVSGYRDFYLEHLYERASFYDSLALQLTGRRMNHVLLLHHNLAASLFLGDLITHFKAKGWEVMDAEKAFQDPIYQSEPQVIPAGESLIWALAKESGKFENQLRYPAEDGAYEKEKMDRRGL